MAVCKYNAALGKFYLIDREYKDGAWDAKQRDVTDNFEAAFDMENVLQGWMRFPKAAPPELSLVTVGSDPGEQPSEDHRHGLRVILKMADELDGAVDDATSRPTDAAAGQGLPCEGKNEAARAGP